AGAWRALRRAAGHLPVPRHAHGDRFGALRGRQRAARAARGRPVSAFGSARVRQLQRWVMQRLRRSRFFPVTIPDRLGDDDALAGTSLRHSVLVYFPETQESLYQLVPWL